MTQLEYFGNGPHENYPGDCGAIKSRYSTAVAEMFPAAYPLRSGGGRSQVKWVKFSDSCGKTLQITGGSEFTFSALPFSEFVIDDAALAGKLPTAESEISLYIDCRIGNIQKIKAGVYRMTLFFSSPVTA
jgi:beta-galactosidase